MTNPTLSVTVTNYNYAGYLAQNLDSILSQSFEDFEVIVVDNASTDDSLEIIGHYAVKDPRVRVVAHERNVGLLASVRESCDLSRGRYRVHVDADDWVLAADAFEVQVDMLDRHPSMAFVYPSTTLMGSNGEVFATSHPYDGDVALPGEDALEAILGFNLTHTGMMMRLDAYRATAGYSPDFRYLGDVLLGIRLCEVGDVGYIDRQLYAWRQHNRNDSVASQLKTMKVEVLPIIDLALGGPLGPRLSDPAALRRRTVRAALVHMPTQLIFSGQLKTGWRLYWESCKLHPAVTIMQPRTISLLSRTLLGNRGHEWLRTRVGRPPSRRR